MRSILILSIIIGCGNKAIPNKEKQITYKAPCFCINNSIKEIHVYSLGAKYLLNASDSSYIFMNSVSHIARLDINTVILKGLHVKINDVVAINNFYSDVIYKNKDSLTSINGTDNYFVILFSCDKETDTLSIVNFNTAVLNNKYLLKHDYNIGAFLKKNIKEFDKMFSKIGTVINNKE